MVKTFCESADFAAFRIVDGDIYRVAWAKTMQIEKTEDGQEKESSLCDYMLERYNYKPDMDLVLNDILTSGEQASMEELREISEGLGAEPLGYLKKASLAYITAYDSSTTVNNFSIDGKHIWLDRGTRLVLRQRFAAEQATGATKTSLWHGTDVFNLSVEEAIRMLNEIEVYACKCYDVTAAHKAAVQKLTTVQELLGYDYRTGYPDKLKFKTTGE